MYRNIICETSRVTLLHGVVELTTRFNASNLVLGRIYYSPLIINVSNTEITSRLLAFL